MNWKTLAKTILSIPLLVTPLHLQAADPRIEVFKTVTCGCCGKWVEHLKANGFAPVVKDVPSTAEYRKQYGVPEGLQSCHTAVVAGYFVEGHVPAADIHKLLKEKPKAAKGLAVPGMPLGSPGMEGPRRQAYAVYMLESDGKISVFTKHPGD
jgi:hypothetical protein